MNTNRQELMLIARRRRAARDERSFSPARVLDKGLDWFVSNVRTLQEHTEALWRKHANVTRP
jgi:hypothetical protein